MNNAQSKERQSQWIKRKQQDMFRGSSTQLYVPAFTQKDFESTSLFTKDSHTGNLQRGFGAIQPGVPNSSLKHNRHLGTTLHLYQRGIQNNTNSTSPRGSKNTISTSTQEGANQQMKRLQLGGLTTTNNFFSHKTKGSYRIL